MICPYGNIGDLLYVRETWALVNGCDYFYKAGFKPNVVFQNVGELKWKPSIHMPKDAARIWLEITGVRVEALQNISSRDAVLEGMPENGQPFVGQFKNLWCKINGVGSWDQNPFVWIVEFKKVTKPCQ